MSRAARSVRAGVGPPWSFRAYGGPVTLGPPLVPTRRRELDELVARVADASAQRSALVVVTAPTGAGLSTFVRAFAARCGPGREVPAAVCHALLGLPWQRSSDGAVLSSVAGPTVGADPVLVAERWLGTLVTGTAGWDAVVVVEDAQHADALSVQALVTAVHRPGSRRVLVVLGWRLPGGPLDLTSEGTAGTVDDLLHDSVVGAADHVVRLADLGPEDVGLLAEQAGVVLPASQVDRLRTHSGGRLRSVVEILRAVPSEDWSSPYFSLPAPATALRLVGSRLAVIEEPARRLVRSAAVLEAADRQARAVAVRDAAAVAGVEDAVVAVGEGVRAGLLTALDEHTTWVRLPDPVVRRAVLDDLGPGERAALHRTAAATLADPALALRHSYFAARLPDEDLAGRLESAAADKARAGAWAAAADLLVLAARASADSGSGGTRLVKAVDALVGAGDVPGASRFLAELESLRETPLRNAVLGYLAIVRGRPGEAENRLGRAWEMVNPGREADTASLIAQRYVLHNLGRCRAQELVTWADRAMELADPDTPAAIEAAAIRGLGAAVSEGIEPALAEYRTLLDRVPAGPVVQRVTMAAGWLHLAGDDLDRAREELESAVPTDFLGGSLRISLWARAWLARVHFQTGDWAEALATASAGAELAQGSGMTLLLPLLEWTRTQVHTLRGDWEAAERSLRAGDAAARDYEIMRVPAALARASLNEARADYGAVGRALLPLTQPWAREWVNQPGFWPWADVYANALVLLGRSAEADEFLRPHEERAEATGHVSTRARLAYARGRWHGLQGDLAASRASFQQATELLEPLPLRYDRARVHFAHGQTLRRAGRRAEADAVMSAAREAYLALGASTYVARCDREIAAGGVNMVRTTREFADLTPQEEAVAALVARGGSNKEVAAELFLSVKTVQYHLTRIYNKLGIRSRAELAALRAKAEPAD